MGPEKLKWFIPVRNSVGNGMTFPVADNVRRILRGMRSDLSRVENGEVFEDERVYRRDQNGNWTHD
jgi:hypothetical protein